MNARYYDCTTGQFISRDTYLGNAYNPWTQNLYTYTGNNPINYTDPTGHFSITVAVGSAIVGGAYGFISSMVSGNSLSDAIIDGISGGITLGFVTTSAQASMFLAFSVGATGKFVADIVSGRGVHPMEILWAGVKNSAYYSAYGAVGRYVGYVGEAGINGLASSITGSLIDTVSIGASDLVLEGLKGVLYSNVPTYLKRPEINAEGINTEWDKELKEAYAAIDGPIDKGPVYGKYRWL